MIALEAVTCDPSRRNRERLEPPLIGRAPPGVGWPPPPSRSAPPFRDRRDRHRDGAVARRDRRLCHLAGHVADQVGDKRYPDGIHRRLGRGAPFWMAGLPIRMAASPIGMAISAIPL